jgi:monooxygenase
MNNTHKDIIIIGAGLSGIGAACHLSRKNPNKTYTILESREELGGTWSLFKYPGIRSDSDMYTFGYSFKTWDNQKSFADAPSILKYLNEATDEYKVRNHIIYQQRAISYNFNTEKKLWTVTTANTLTGEELIYTCSFIFSCSGYYNYTKGHTPEFKGQAEYEGEIIHPQKWPENLDCSNKKIVVIGSGATAVTIVPKLASQASHITMLQRSPTYIGALPNKDKVGTFMKRIFSKKLAYSLIRLKNILYSIVFFNLCRSFPETMKKFIIKGAKKELGDFPVDPHFTPNYKPWEQRFCIAPDGDFFKVIKEGQASVITDNIDRFKKDGIILKSGETIEADIIITATGLNILALGGVKISIDSITFDVSKSFTYKGVMLSDLPNFFVFIGYTNASWTLKSDLTSEYISRVLKYLDKHNYTAFQAKVIEETLESIPLLNLNSGYINRSANALPKQGNKKPWHVYQNYILDYKLLRIDKVKDEWLTFF